MCCCTHLVVPTVFIANALLHGLACDNVYHCVLDPDTPVLYEMTDLTRTGDQAMSTTSTVSILQSLMIYVVALLF